MSRMVSGEPGPLRWPAPREYSPAVRAAVELGPEPGHFVIRIEGITCPCGCGYELTLRVPVEFG